MGTSAMGFASSLIPGFDIHMLGEILECKLQPTPPVPTWQLTPKFDPRNVGDVAVAWSSRCLIVRNSDFCDDLLFRENRRSYDRLVEVTGIRGCVVFFCIYDSGGSYGFSMFEDGLAVRHRLYSVAFPQVLSIMRGKPLAIEEPWLPAILTDEERQEFDPEEYDSLFRHQGDGRLASEQGLNAILVEEVLKSEFGFSLQDGAVDGQKFHDQTYRAATSTESRPVQPLPLWRRIIR